MVSKQWVGGDLNVNDIPQDAQVLNYNVELRPAFGTNQDIYGLCGRFMVGY
jgi:hypothetical protein